MVNVTDVIVRNSLIVVKNLWAVDYVYVATDILLMGPTIEMKGY
jgi:hypothetical protein